MAAMPALSRRLASSTVLAVSLSKRILQVTGMFRFRRSVVKICAGRAARANHGHTREGERGGKAHGARGVQMSRWALRWDERS